jgi:hypothetical protein
MKRKMGKLPQPIRHIVILAPKNAVLHWEVTIVSPLSIHHPPFIIHHSSFIIHHFNRMSFAFGNQTIRNLISGKEN